MNNEKGLVFLGIVLGVVFLIIGYIYATHSAGKLPSFFPGYTAGSSHVHIKHSIASFIVGIACFVFAWFKSGPKTT
jgi:hypothetical protein